MKRALLILSLILLIGPAQGQSLIIKRGKKGFTPAYSSGDQITLKLKGEKRFMTDMITGFYSDGIEFRGIKVALNEIERVKLVFSHGLYSPSNGKKMIIAGFGLFLIDQFNNSVVQGNEATISQPVTIASAALVAFGTLWMSLRHRNIKLGVKNRLMVITSYNQSNLLDK